ncbi:COBW P47K family protein [Cryptosporidium andersoni]|uniref:COBW P47K family protein n=1 Tax=Cryptosporidium andersoni TaxID=117008 RepID=A0A1J4MSM7_9CRYT|nr:COBW P47K family protein [Cryptosporidium andersoni]
MTKVPVSIVTGFLGSGKTTLLRHIVKTLTTKKIAIIQNEFSDEMGIESPTVVDSEGQLFKEFYELPNGCVCCSVRGELIRAVDHLLSVKRFDKILVETTGITDPEPLVEIFWTDEELGSKVMLDGIITVVDALNIQSYLNLTNKDIQDIIELSIETNNKLITEKTRILSNLLMHQYDDISITENKYPKLVIETIKQIIAANKIILNKIDLLDINENNSDSDLSTIEKIIHFINPTAEISRTIRSSVPIDWIFDINGFNINSISLEFDRFQIINEIMPMNSINPVNYISNEMFTFQDYIFNPEAIEKFIAFVVWDSEKCNNKLGTLVRYKGIFKGYKDEDKQEIIDYALQGVGKVFEVVPLNSETLKISKFLFIGFNLKKQVIHASLVSCIA